jgi:hypothetical protein
MRAVVLAPIVLASAIVASACDSNSVGTAPSGSSQEQLTLRLTTTHFRILGDRTAAETLQAVADSLETAYPRVTSDLSTGPLPVITVSVWQDQASFYEAMRQNLGQVYTGSTGYVTGLQGLMMLATSAAGKTAAHEFSHIVSLAVNTTFGNNPRWLWETVALYENREFVDPATLDFLAAGRYPTIASLDADFNTNRQIYQVGFVLGEFVVATWGQDGLLRLVRSNGQVQATFGVSVTEFEQRWYAFLQAKYRVPPPAG